MLEFGSYLRVEWKLLVRSPLFWFCTAVALLDAWLNVSINRDAVDYGYWTGQTGFLYIAPLSMLATLIGVQAAARDRALKADCLVDSLPYRPAPLLIARLVLPAVWFVALGLVPALLLVNFWMTRLNGGPPIGNLVLPVCVLQLGMAYLLIIGWAIGRYFSGRIGFLVGFVVWLVHGYLVVLALNAKLPAILYGLPNIFLYDYRSMGFLDVVWGFRSGLGLWMHQGFYAALTALFTLLLLVHAFRQRGERYSRVRWHGAIGVVAGLALLCGIGYAWVRETPAAYAAKLEHSIAGQTAIMQGTLPDDRPSFQVSDYRLSVRYDGGKLHVVSEMRLSSAQSDPSFTLRDAFIVEKAEADGQPATWKRRGNSLLLDTSGKSVRHVVLTYSGSVMDWRMAGPYNHAGSMLFPVRFATATQLYLPGAYGWYPLPGEHMLVGKEMVPATRLTRIRDFYPELSPSHYQVSIDYPDGLKLFSNLILQSRKQQNGRQVVVFEATGAEAAVLLGGPLKQVAGASQPEYRMIVSELTEEKAADHAAEVSGAALAEARRVIGDSTRPPLLLAVDSVHADPGQEEGGVLTVNAPMFRIPDDQLARSMVISYIGGREAGAAKNPNSSLFSSLTADYVAYRTTGSFGVEERYMRPEERQATAYFAQHDSSDSVRKLQAFADWLRQHDEGKPPIENWFSG